MILPFLLALMAGGTIGWWLATRRRRTAAPAPSLADYCPGFTSRHRLEKIATSLNLRIQLIDRNLMYVDAIGRARPDETYAEAVIGATVGDGMTPEQAAPHLAAARRALAGETLSYIWDWVMPGEPVRWHRTMVSPVGLAVDDITGLISATNDISVEVTAREEVERDRARFRTTFAASPVATVLSRLEDGLILHVNDSFCALTGYSRGDVVGRTATDLSLWADSLRDRIGAELREHGTVLSLDSTIRTKAGDERITLTSLQIADLDGAPCVMRTDYDITERRRAQEALQISEEKFRSLVYSLDDLVLELSPDLTIAAVHGGGALLSRDPVGRVEGRTFAQVLGVPSLPRHEEACGAALAGGHPLYDLELPGPEGTRHLQVSLSPLRGPAGAVSGLVLVGRDLTQLRRTEFELTARDRRLQDVARVESLGRLAGGVAHDFNNLLTIINGYADLLLRGGALRDADVDKVREIGKAGHRAAELTGQLLAFGRRQVLQPRVLDLNLIVEEMSTMLRRLIGADITLVIRLDPALGRVQGDPGQIGQVMMNLAANARDAMPAGGRLAIETANAQVSEEYARWHDGLRAGRYVRLMVSDSGTGMDRAVRERVFEPFFTTKEIGKGTGLGLATVYGIVRQSEGEILLYTEPGHGTTFKIYLPRVDDPAGAGAAPETPALGGRETILVAEDEPVIRFLARQVLERAGYTVLEAADGREAQALLECHSGGVDLLLTDIVMPRLTGAELARIARERRPGLRVLFMSGYSDLVLGDATAAGTRTEYLAKPFQPDELLTRVRELLDLPAPRA